MLYQVDISEFIRAAGKKNQYYSEMSIFVQITAKVPAFISSVVSNQLIRKALVFEFISSIVAFCTYWLNK